MGTPTYVKPEFSDFEKCVAYARAFYTNAGGAGTEDELSEIVGNRPTSSWFTLKLNAMRGYGLVEVNGNLIQTTELALRIIRPRDESEEANGLRDAVRSFPLFGSLVEKYQGKGEPGEKFVKNVLETEGAKPNQSTDWANCFLAAARYVRLFESEKPAQPQARDEKLNNPEATVNRPEKSSLLTDKELNEGWLIYPVPVSTGVARIIVPRNLPHNAWDKLKKLLDAIEPESKNGPEGPS